MALSRSEQMARIRGSNTSPELLLRRGLWERGLRYRLHGKTPDCKPDLVFPAARLAVFVDGCQWHGCPGHYGCPRSRSEFWSRKLEANVLRDGRQTRRLTDAGWRVFRVWEHDIYLALGEVVDQIAEALVAPEWAPAPYLRVIRVESIESNEFMERRFLVKLGETVPTSTLVRRRSTTKWKMQ